MELPAILKEENVEAAAELLRRYYLEPSAKSGGLLSTGSYFDEWANRGDGPGVKDRITDSDAVAVSMLSVKVPARPSSDCRKSRWLRKYGTSWRRSPPLM